MAGPLPLTLPMRNLVAAFAVYAAFLVLLLVSPDYSLQEAELLCDRSGAAVATFPNMDACTQDIRFKEGKCGCMRPPSLWARWYVLAVVPFLGTVVGFVLLRGSFRTRLRLLNISIAAAIISGTVRSVLLDPAAGMGVPLVPIVLIGFCAGSSALFAALYFGKRAIRGRANNGK